MHTFHSRLRRLTALAFAAVLLLPASPAAARAVPPDLTSTDPPRPSQPGAVWTSTPRQPSTLGKTAAPGQGRKLDLTGPAVSPAALTKRFRAADTVSLTLKHLDESGGLTANAATSIANLDGSLNERIEIGNGAVTLQLPRGRYLLVGAVLTGPSADETTNFLAQPLLDLQADRTVELDARQAKQLDVTTDNPAAGSYLAALYLSRRMDDGSMAEATTKGRLNRLKAAQLGADLPAPELTSSLVTHWGIPGPAGDFTDSPVTYGSLDTVHGRFFSGFRRTVRVADLARVDSRLHSTVADSKLFKTVTIVPPDSSGGWPAGVPYSKPGTMAEYIEPAALVAGALLERSSDDPNLLIAEVSARTLQSFQVGQRYFQNWNQAVLSPHIAPGNAVRYGNEVATSLSMLTDQAGHEGWSPEGTRATRLYRDGKLLGETDVPGKLRGIDVGTGRGRLRLETHQDRTAVSQRSTIVDAAWTFDSEPPVEGEVEPLPLWVFRFQPEVGLRNDTKAGAVTALPFTLAPTAEAKAGRPGKPAVEISGDRGKTWRSATVVPKGAGEHVAVFAVPAGAKTISLRAKATDSAGNTVEQTVIAAYGLR